MIHWLDVLLEGRFDEIVFIITLFARKLLIQEKETIAMLQDLLQDRKAYPFITADSVRECLIQADLLLTRIRRFHF